ncbi:MAG TPA: hypothetical protein DEW35_02235 [Ruminococcaceae bacterium]|nr:hypothetical protein [Oscillospiraceae bacterium]
MASYYYLMSSLPMLRADGTMPITYKKFLSYCKDSVSGANYELLENLSVDSKKGVLISEWAEFYSAFKEELTYQRNKKAEKSVPQPTGVDIEVKKTISAAVNDENPLNAENTLLALQFDRLDSLIGIHSFDDYALFGYAMKLKLLERKTVFDQKAGKDEFTRLVKGLEEQINRIN